MSDMPMAKIAQALDDFLKQQGTNNRLVLGIDHQETEGMSLKFLSDPKVAQVLQKRGMQTLAIEAPVALQNEVDDLSFDTEQTPEGYAKSIAKQYESLGEGQEALSAITERYKGQGEALKAQSSFGNAVLFYDNPDLDLGQRNEQIKRSHVLMAEADDAMVGKIVHLVAPTLEALGKAGVPETEEMSMRLAGQLKGQIFKDDPEVREKYKAFQDSRVTDVDEEKRAKHILENKNSEGVVVIAGQMHGAGHNDLDEKLGASRLVVTMDKNEFLELSQRGYAQGEERPEGFLILSEGKIVSGTDAYNDARKFEQTLNGAMKGQQMEQAPVKPAVSQQASLQM